MRDATRLTLERALQLAIAATIVASVLAAGSLLSWVGFARQARWVGLVAVAALAVVYAVGTRNAPPGRAPYVGAAALVGLAGLSAAWSIVPRLTIERAGALAVLFVACGALDYGTAGRPEAVRRLLGGVLLGAAAVAVGGLLVLAFRHDRAIQPATTELAARYQGLGGGPNTATMVLAVAVPLGALALVTARRRRAAGAVAAAVLLILVGSIVASGSRGALAGAFAGLALFAGLAPAEVRTRVAAVAAIAVLFAVAVAITRIPDPARASTASAVSPVETSAARPRHGFLDANVVWRLQDEVGKPPYGSADTTKRPRTLFGTSGRAQAWQGTLDLAGERPLLGFGFGTEDRAFVDRYSGFNSNVPENSYLGLFLQLGAIGLTALALLVGAVLVRLRTLSSLAREQRLVAAAATAALVAGLAVGLFQSFLTSVGNNATAAVWICAFLALAATTPPDVVRSSS